MVEICTVTVNPANAIQFRDEKVLNERKYSLTEVKKWWPSGVRLGCPRGLHGGISGAIDGAGMESSPTGY